MSRYGREQMNGQFVGFWHINTNELDAALEALR